MDYIITVIILIRQRQTMTDQQLTQLDHFLMRNNQQPTPKRSYIIAPNPKQTQTHHPRQTSHLKQNQPLINHQSRSPARCTSKSHISSHDNSQTSLNLSRQRARSRKSVRATRKRCENHEELEGSYRINIEGEELYYCEKCANKLKGQGFPIKMNQKSRSNTRSRIETSEGNSIQSSYPHLDGHPQFHILKMLLTTIYNTEKEIYTHNTQQPTLDKLYEQASDAFETKMDNLEQIIRLERIRGRKVLKKALMENQQHSVEERIICESLNEIKVMKTDIEENIESIVGQIDTETFEQCVQNYKEKIDILKTAAKEHSQQLEEAKNKFERISQQTYHNIRSIIQSSTVNNMQDSEDQSMNCNEGPLIDRNHQEDRSAFRNLFQGPKLVRRRGVSANQ